MQQQVENRDEETLELKETYSSLQQEVDIKTKKLKKVANLLPLEPKPLLVSIDSFNQCFFYRSISHNCIFCDTDCCFNVTRLLNPGSVNACIPVWAIKPRFRPHLRK